MRFATLLSTHRPPDVVETRLMPSDFSISLANLGAADRRIVEAGEAPRRQAMRGFEDTFTDIVDFIVKVTHHIWEEKAVGYLYESYRHNARVVDDSGLVYGRDRVIESTLQLIAAFPDLRLFADEVIWCGDDVQGFSCSHRVVVTGHNTGYSEFGPPTRRRVTFTCIANTTVVDNQIYEEHVIYNTGSTIRQLGHDLTDAAYDLGSRARVHDPTTSQQERSWRAPTVVTATSEARRAGGSTCGASATCASESGGSGRSGPSRTSST